MKAYEKWAKDAAQESADSGEMENATEELYVLGYIAGFKKARSMGADLLVAARPNDPLIANAATLVGAIGNGDAADLPKDA